MCFFDEFLAFRTNLPLLWGADINAIACKDSFNGKRWHEVNIWRIKYDGNRLHKALYTCDYCAMKCINGADCCRSYKSSVRPFSEPSSNLMIWWSMERFRIESKFLNGLRWYWHLACLSHIVCLPIPCHLSTPSTSPLPSPLFVFPITQNSYCYEPLSFSSNTLFYYFQYTTPFYPHCHFMQCATHVYVNNYNYS